MMRVVVKVLGFAVAAWAVLGFVFRDHPLLGTLYLGLRVPLLLVCFLLGGWAVRQHSLRLVGLVLLGLALLFAPWLHTLLVRASPVEMARNGTPVRVLTANVMAQGGDPVLVLEAVHGHPCDLCFFQEVTPEWKTRLEKEGVLRPHVPFLCSCRVSRRASTSPAARRWAQRPSSRAWCSASC